MFYWRSAGVSARYDVRMRLSVRVTPRASRDAVDGFDEGGTLRVRVTAAPAEGAANEAVTKLLAKALGIPLRDIALISGATSRTKLFEVALEPAELGDRLT